MSDHEPALSHDWRLLGTVERCAMGCLAYTGTAESAAYPEWEWHYEWDYTMERMVVGKGRKRKQKAKRTTANKPPKLAAKHT